MASYQPPTALLSIFNENEFISNDTALTIDQANNLYLKLSGGILTGNLTCSNNLSVLGISNFSNGTVALPSITFSSDPNLGIYRVGADDLGFSTNGVLRLDISTTALTSALPTLITDTTQSTSPTTGCLILSGGLGVAKQAHIDGKLHLTGTGSSTASSAAFYSAPASTVFSGSNSYYFNVFDVPVTTGSTSAVASTVRIVGSPPNATTAYSLHILAGTSYLGDHIQNNGVFINFGTTPSTSTTTGSVVLSGGICNNNSSDAVSASNGGNMTLLGGCAIGKKLFVGTGINLPYIDGTNTNAQIKLQRSDLGYTGLVYMDSSGHLNMTNSGGFNLLFNTNGNLRMTISTAAITSTLQFSVTNTTASTSSTTGAIINSGGSGISKNLWIGSNFSSTVGASSLDGSVFNIPNLTFTNTDGAGTSATNNIFSIRQPTLASSNGTVTTKASSMFIGGAPIKGANQTFTNCYGLYIDSVSTTSATVTEAASLYIANAPTVTSGTVYALKVAAGVSNFADTTASTSSSTGSIITAGGISSSNTTDASSSTNGGSITTAGGFACAKSAYIGTNLTVSGTYANAAQSRINVSGTGSTQTLSNNTYTLINSAYNTASVTGSDISFASGVVTINTSGIYYIGVSCVFDSNANGIRHLALSTSSTLTDNSAFLTAQSLNGNASVTNYLNCSTIASLSATSTVRAIAYQNSTASLALTLNTSQALVCYRIA